MSANDRLANLEAAVAELGDRLQGIHQPERFRAMMPAVAPFVEALRAGRQAAREAAEAAKPKPTVDLKQRYRPVTTALLDQRMRGD